MTIRFYPDTNVVHELCTSWTPADFDSLAEDKGLLLCLSHQTYELARSFIYSHPQEAVIRAFKFLAEIRSVEYLPSVNESIKAEAFLARTGTPAHHSNRASQPGSNEARTPQISKRVFRCCLPIYFQTGA